MNQPRNTTQRSRDPLLSTEELAAYLNVSVKSIYKYRELDNGPRAYNVGKGLRYRLSDVDAWLETRVA